MERSHLAAGCLGRRETLVGVNNSRTVPPRRQRHLIDPNDPRPRQRDPEALARLHRVQRWVLSTLAVSTGLHLVVGIIAAAFVVDVEARPQARVGLLVISALFGVGAVAAGLAIHRRSVLTPWLLLGVVPALVGAWLLHR